MCRHCCFSVVKTHCEEGIGAHWGRCDPAEQMCSSGTDKWAYWPTQLRPSWPTLGCPSPGPAPLPGADHPSFWLHCGHPSSGAGKLLQNMNSKGCGAADTRLTCHLAVWLVSGSHQGVSQQAVQCCSRHVLSAALTRHSGEQLLPYWRRRFPAWKASQNQNMQAGGKAREIGVDGRCRHQCHVLLL